jgi:hypothetical protein
VQAGGYRGLAWTTGDRWLLRMPLLLARWYVSLGGSREVVVSKARAMKT